jgi:hypothetical protein
MKADSSRRDQERLVRNELIRPLLMWSSLIPKAPRLRSCLARRDRFRTGEQAVSVLHVLKRRRVSQIGGTMQRMQKIRKVIANCGACTLASVTLASALLVSGWVDARPGKIPPPPAEAPAAGESPATGQPAPADAANPKEMPQPTGKQCTEGADQSQCDKMHMGNEQGKKPTNTPSDAWYKDMAKQMYELQQALDGMIAWSNARDPMITYYSKWLRGVVQQYYSYGYEPVYAPRRYSFGPMSRGDYNYYYYYWVQPLYYALMYRVVAYRIQYPRDASYLPYLGGVALNYHDLVRCNYGFNGDDQAALEDSQAYSIEAAVGLSTP